MKKWKIGLLVAVAVLLLAPTLKTALNNMALIFLMMVLLRFIVRFVKTCWIPLLFIAAVLYLSLN